MNVNDTFDGNAISKSNAMLNYLCSLHMVSIVLLVQLEDALIYPQILGLVPNLDRPIWTDWTMLPWTLEKNLDGHFKIIFLSCSVQHLERIACRPSFYRLNSNRLLENTP